MTIRELYHGTSGDNLLRVMHDGHLKPNSRGEVFFVEHDYGPALGYGPDLKRRASYAAKVRVTIPAGAKFEAVTTAGAPRGAVVLKTVAPVSATVLELYVREKGASEVKVIRGEAAIKQYLDGSGGGGNGGGAGGADRARRRERRRTKNRLRGIMRGQSPRKSAKTTSGQSKSKTVPVVRVPKTTPRVEPTQAGTAKIGGILLALDGAHFLLQIIVDYLVQKRVEEALAKQWPAVKSHLADRKEFGALIVIRFYQQQFVGIEVAYGLTEEDAKRTYFETPQLQPADHEAFLTFIPPIEEVHFSKWPTPFAKLALARFKPGKEAVYRVGFTGDDDQPFDETRFVELENPDRVEVRFLVLVPPKRMGWYNRNGRWIDAEVPCTVELAASGEALDVVDLDRNDWFDFGGDVAVPVFPVNDAARVAFAAYGTRYVSGSVYAQYPGLQKTAWVRPGAVEVLSLLK